MRQIAKKNKRDIITEQAAALFKERSYPAVSMNDIADKVGVKAASLYNHIKSKEDILQEICFRFAHEYVTQLDEIALSNQSISDKIAAIIDLHVALSTHNAAAIIITNYEWKHLSEPYLSDFKAMRKSYEKTFMDIITEGVAKGVLKNIDPTIVMFTVLSALRWIPFWYNDKRGVTIEDLKNNIKTLIIKGLEIE
jgi:AcrR family transcriptional regulator